MAWELKEANRQAAARETLARLIGGEPPRPDDYWYPISSETVALLLSQVFQVDEALCDSLQRSLLDDLWQGHLCEQLARRREFNAALRVARATEDPDPHLKEIAFLLMEACLHRAERQAETAAGLVAGVMAIAEEIKGHKSRCDLLRETAILLVREGRPEACDLFGAAIASAWQIEDPKEQAIALRETALLVREGRPEACDLFGAALALAWQIEDPEEQAIALWQIAEAKGGDRALFAAAIASAQRVEDAGTRAWLMGRIGRSQAAAGDSAASRASFAIAREVGCMVSDSEWWGRSESLAQTADAQIEAGDLAGALQTADRIESSGERSGTLKSIAAALGRSGDTEGARDILLIARELARAVEEPDSPALYLADLAETEVEVGATGAAGETFAMALATARQIDDREERDRTLKSIGEAQARAGLFDAAAETARQIATSDLRFQLWEKSVAELASRGLFEEALSAVKRIEVTQHRDQLWRGLVSKMVSLGSFDLALKTAEWISSDEERSKGLAVIAEGQPPAEILSALVANARTIGDATSRARVLEAIATAEAQAGRGSAARDLLAQGLQAEAESHFLNRYPVEALMRAGAFAAALQIALGIPDERECSRALGALCEWGSASPDEVARALAIAEQLEEPGTASSVREIIVHAAVRAGALDAAWQALERVEIPRHRAQALAALAMATAQAGEHETARATFEAALAIARGIEDREARARALCAIAAAQAKAGEADAACETFAAALVAGAGIPEIPAYFWSPAQSTAAAQLEAAIAQAEGGEFAAALRTARGIEEDADRLTALERIAVAQAEAGQSEAARETCEEALAVARQRERTDDQVRCLVEIARVQVEIGLRKTGHATCQEALELALRLEDGDDQVRCLVEVAGVQASIGMREASLDSVERVLQLARREFDVVYGLHGDLNSLAASYAKWGGHFSVIQENVLASVYELVACYAELGHFSEALYVAEQIGTDWRAASGNDAFDEMLRVEFKGSRDYALVWIAVAQANAGEFVAARATIERIEDRYQRVQALLTIARAQRDQGEPQAARETLATAFEVARSITISTPQPNALHTIAVAQAQAGFVEDAMKTLAAVEQLDAGEMLPVAAAFADAGEARYFKCLLPDPSKTSIAAAYEWCSLLTRMYPQQKRAVLAAMRSATETGLSV